MSSPFSELNATLPATMYLLGARNRIKSKKVRYRKYTDEDDKVLREITAQYFPDGFTIWEQAGNWKTGSTLVEEDSRTVLVVGGDIKKHESWRNQIAATFQQVAIIKIDLPTAALYITDPDRLKKIPPNKKKK